MTTPQEVLAGVPLFSMLPKKEVAKLARKAHELTVPAGTVVTLPHRLYAGGCSIQSKRDHQERPLRLTLHESPRFHD